MFVTKYRRKVLKHGMGAYLQVAMKAMTRHYPDVPLLEINTDIDHVHLLVSIPPRYSVSKIVNLLKSNSARAMRKKFPFLKTMYEKEGIALWSTGYFVSTVGIDEGVIRKYIEHQGEEDRGQVRLVLGE
ncbi:IS200/IS605 family transposase [Patescibacteria group bacterium]|nr:IS200/IS605 family transposase [Patescibacteria group bacterium]